MREYYIYINSNIEYTIQRIHIASYYTHSTRKWKISIVLSPYWQKLFWYLFIFIWYSWNTYVEVKDIYIFISNECQQNFYYIPIHTRKTCIQLKSFQSIWQGVIFLNVCAIWFYFVSDYFANSRGHCTFRASITLHLSIIEMKRIQNGFDWKSCNRILRLNITNGTRNLKFWPLFKNPCLPDKVNQAMDMWEGSPIVYILLLYCAMGNIYIIVACHQPLYVHWDISLGHQAAESASKWHKMGNKREFSNKAKALTLSKESESAHPIQGKWKCSPCRWKCQGRQSLGEMLHSSCCFSWPAGNAKMLKD